MKRGDGVETYHFKLSMTKMKQKQQSDKDLQIASLTKTLFTTHSYVQNASNGMLRKLNKKYKLKRELTVFHSTSGYTSV